MPKVTALMPVHNGASYLSDALDSLLAEDVAGFEVCVIDDASSDETPQILAGYADERLRVIRHETNLGVAQSLNRGIDECESDYIVRMDADDVVIPGRIKKQVAFMDAHPEIGVCGAWVQHIGAHEGAIEKRPVGSSEVAAFMLLDNPIIHPTVIMRRSLLNDHHLRYDPDFGRSEDFDLWERASRCFSLANLPEVLLKFRVHSTSVTAVHGEEMWTQTYELLRRGLRRIGLEMDDEEIRFYRAGTHGDCQSSLEDLRRVSGCLTSVRKANRESQTFDEHALARACAFAWQRVCQNSSRLGLGAFRAFWQSDLGPIAELTFSEKSRFLGVAFYYHLVGRSRGEA